MTYRVVIVVVCFHVLLWEVDYVPSDFDGQTPHWVIKSEGESEGTCGEA